MNKSVVIGIHGFSSTSKSELHNTGCALCVNGHVVAALDEERCSRKKNDGSFPRKSLKYILESGTIGADDVYMVAMPDKSPVSQLILITRNIIRVFLETGIFMSDYWFKSAKRTVEWKRNLPSSLHNKRRILVEHHLAHASSVYYTAPWSKATIITLDGMGDYATGGIVAYGDSGKINVIKRTNGFYSPGILYSIITDLLGFIPGRHEGKVMGLAAMGNPELLYPLFSEIISYRKSRLDFYSTILPYEINDFLTDKPVKLQKIRKLLEGYKRDDIAAALQKTLEDIICDFVRDAIKITGDGNLMVSGGIFANVVLNQKIAELPEVKNLYVFPAMSDSGLSVGAALYGYYHTLENTFTPKPLDHVYLGPGYTNAEISTFLDNAGISYKFVEEPEFVIASYLAEGKTVAHFNGKEEYGPRALGNRSVFAPAIDKSINEKLNNKLRRTEFMPFAPVMTDKFASRYLVDWNPADINSGFMTITYHATEELTNVAPAVVHTDGTARPQVILENINPRLYGILNEYARLTGVGTFINTSFNIHEEPIVNTPSDALKILQQNVVDVLVINNMIITST